MKNAFFTSDYHLFHANVIKYDNRPFLNVEEMNQTIIENHNKIVQKDDDFYFLGDFAFAKEYEIEKLISQLNGNLHFIKGNHDKYDTINLYKKYGNYLGELKEIFIFNKKIVLCHYAMRVWNKSHHGTWHLYGHSHGSLPDDPNSLSMDVGIMNNNYYPFSFDQIEELMSKKTFKPIDHHGN